ncbi:crossover junction endodeoxyribonuclease RuvC [Clostridia bacterium]|nr:crossover junction endodeoxyribonuclease RuvC [Clostridia bacterium]
MIILGIDPGLATVGYGVIEKNGAMLRPIDYGVILTPKEESTAVRLAMLNEQLTALIQKFRPDCVAVEELFFNDNAKTAIMVAEGRGVILLTAVKECGRLYEYTPLQIKSALTGNGRADKNQVQYMVRAILKIQTPIRPDDAADALAAAICHANTNQILKDNKI